MKRVEMRWRLQYCESITAGLLGCAHWLYGGGVNGAPFDEALVLCVCIQRIQISLLSAD